MDGKYIKVIDYMMRVSEESVLLTERNMRGCLRIIIKGTIIIQIEENMKECDKYTNFIVKETFANGIKYYGM